MELRRELGSALRTLLRHRAYALLAVATLALTVGVGTALFSVIDAVLVQPLPMRDAERLVLAWQNDAAAGIERIDIAYPAFEDWRERSTSFAGLAVLPTTVVASSFDRDGSSVEVRMVSVSRELFEVLGVSPARGRTFLPEEDERGAAPVAVIGHRFWQRHLGGAEEVLGQVLEIDGRSVEVIGVMPRGFEFPHGTDLWVPIRRAEPRYVEDRRVRFLYAVGRLADGVSIEQAREELGGVVAELAKEYPLYNDDFGVALVPLLERELGGVRRVLMTLLVAALAVVLVAGANVAHLVLARALRRRREMALRSALGASGWRRTRPLMAELALLAAAAAALGLVLARWLVSSVLALAPPDIPRLDLVSVDLRSALFALVLSAVLVVVFGALPTLQALRVSAVDLRRAQASPERRRVRELLAVSEVALTLFLVVAAGLLVRSLWQRTAIDPGFSPDRVATFRLNLPPSRYPEPPQRNTFLEQLEERLEAVPGVEDAGLVLLRPLNGPVAMRLPFTVEGQGPEEHASNPMSHYEVVSRGFFETLRVPLRAGRLFGPADREDGEQVAIVGESLARRYWPEGEAVGRRIKLYSPEVPTPWYTVVGVVADVHSERWESPTLDLYLPLRQHPFAAHTPFMDVVLRASGDPLAALPAVRRAVTELDAQLTPRTVDTLERLVSVQLAPSRFHSTLLLTLAAAALLLTVVGVYSIISYSVVCRRRELGVRQALGADRGRILRSVLGRGLAIGLAGVLLGLGLSAALTRYLAGLLFGVEPLDGATLAAAVAVLLLVAALAALIPARRATAVDPMEVLRQE